MLYSGTPVMSMRCHVPVSGLAGRGCDRGRESGRGPDGPVTALP
jgi:hypothetical protein